MTRGALRTPAAVALGLLAAWLLLDLVGLDVTGLVTGLPGGATTTAAVGALVAGVLVGRVLRDRP